MSDAPAGRTRGPRGAYSKTARRRVEILDAALNVFGQEGYRSGSIREVATRIGLSEAGLLHHFASKSELLTAVLEHRDELARPAITAEPQDGLELLRSLVELAKKSAREPGVIELFAILSTEATAPDHPAHDYFRDRYARVRTMLESAFVDLEERRLMASGVDVGFATTSTIALWDGLQIQWLYEPHSVDVAAALERHFRSLVEFDAPIDGGA
jgi:AcrR family transcriptional regulator